MHRLQPAQESSGSAQPNQSSGALPTRPTMDGPQLDHDEGQHGEALQPELGQPKPADSVKGRTRKRACRPTVKEIPYTHTPEVGYPERMVRQKILLIFVDDKGAQTGSTWSEDEAAVGNHMQRVRMVPVRGLFGRLWMSEYPVLFWTEYGALMPSGGHPLQQQITFWKPENEPRYGPRLTYDFVQALRRQALQGPDFPVPPVLNPALPPQVVDAAPMCFQVQPLLFPAPPTHFPPPLFLPHEALEIQHFPDQHLPYHNFPYQNFPDQSHRQQSLLDQPYQLPLQQQVAEQAGLGENLDPPPNL